MNHAPPPWKIDGDNEDTIVTDDGLVAQTYGDAQNAAFIILAVNCHEEMLKALKVALNAIGQHGGNHPACLDAMNQAYEAIVKANGQ